MHHRTPEIHLFTSSKNKYSDQLRSTLSSGKLRNSSFDSYAYSSSSSGFNRKVRDYLWGTHNTHENYYAQALRILEQARNITKMKQSASLKDWYTASQKSLNLSTQSFYNKSSQGRQYDYIKEDSKLMRKANIKKSNDEKKMYKVSFVENKQNIPMKNGFPSPQQVMRSESAFKNQYVHSPNIVVQKSSNTNIQSVPPSINIQYCQKPHNQTHNQVVFQQNQTQNLTVPNSFQGNPHVSSQPMYFSDLNNCPAVQQVISRPSSSPNLTRNVLSNVVNQQNGQKQQVFNMQVPNFKTGLGVPIEQSQNSQNMQNTQVFQNSTLLNLKTSASIDTVGFHKDLNNISRKLLKELEKMQFSSSNSPVKTLQNSLLLNQSTNNSQELVQELIRIRNQNIDLGEDYIHKLDEIIWRFGENKNGKIPMRSFGKNRQKLEVLGNQ